jgi:energy-coupling factor transporter ATP-binding protein EcfA2
MSVALAVEPPAGSPPARFPSLAALREAHVDLLGRRNKAGSSPETFAAIEDFLARGRITGALLDAESDRAIAQSLLDYWAALFYRLDKRTVDATLDDLDPSLVPDLKLVDCPYVGLEAFRERDYSRFFGRQGLIEKAIETLDARRFLVVVGPSGSGKSSLVLGGVLPRLKSRPASADQRYLPPLVPGSEPLRNLAAAILGPEAGTAKIGDLAQRLLREPEHLAELAAGPSSWVVVVDQFEETFTLCRDVPTQQAFARCLRSLVDTPGLPHAVALTLRSDYEGHIKGLPALEPLFEDGLVRVTSMSAAELREVIEKPAEIAGLKFEDGLIETLAKDLQDDLAGLPLLQFTLLKLWETRDRNRVTWSAYKELGSARDALAKSAQKLFDDELSPEERLTAKRILLRMVRPTGSLEVTSSRVRRSALDEIEDPERVRSVLDKLIKGHLVRLRTGETLADAEVEVAHEALIRNWPLLAGWLEEERSRMVIRDRWEAQAKEWVRLGRGTSGLMDEIQLAEANHWLDSADATRLAYSPQFLDLVRASREALEQRRTVEEETHRREVSQARKLAGFAWGLVILLIAVMIVGGIAFRNLQSFNAALQKLNAAREEVARQEVAAKQAKLEKERLEAVQEQARQRTELLLRENKIRTLEDAQEILPAKLEEIETLSRDKAGLQDALRREAEKHATEMQAAQNALREERATRLRAEGERDDLRTALEERVRPEPTPRQERQEDAAPLAAALETPPPAAQKPLPPPVRPLRLGLPVGTEAGAPGVLCCFVKDAYGRRYLIGLASVLRGKPGDTVLQPPLQQGGTAADSAIAKLTRFSSDGVRSAAMAELLPGIPISSRVLNVGKLEGIESAVFRNDKAVLVRAGGGVVGKVVSVDGATITINLPSTPADLGAPVLSDDRELIGMVFGSDGNRTKVVHINRILGNLKIDLIDDKGRPLH